jgi:electron transfer flavoprotein alpha subunit
MPAQNVLGAADRLVFAQYPGVQLVPAQSYGEAALKTIAAEKPDLIIVPYSANGLDVAAFLAARTGYPLASYVVALSPSDTGIEATCQIYAGKVAAQTSLPLPAIVMINPGHFGEAKVSGLSDAKVVIADENETAGIKLDRLSFPDFNEVNLAEAERILCVGRGIGDAESIEQARELADLIGAEIAGSRPVVDRGWLPKVRQVGKSGQKVKPKFYLAMGVSGAPEHLEGMASSGVIIAVNTDPKAPIFGAAHYAATCDLFDLIEAMLSRLRSGKPA